MRIFVLFLLPTLCWSTTTSITVDQLITMARAAPPEFAAEALIRIAAIDKVEKARRIELLEEAFRRAGDAQLAYKRKASIVKITGPAGVYNRTAAQGLDAMSLRLKAVRAMLALDPVRGREMFRRIPPMKLPKLKCEEFMVYDVDNFYDVLEHVARESFTPAEVEKGEAFRLFDPYIAAMTSPVQLTGAARLVAGSNVSDAEFRLLLADYAKALSKMTGDDRSFTYSAAGPQIRAMMLAAEKRNVPAGPLLEAYRLYIVSNMSGPRCADDELMVYQGTAFAFADPRGVDQQGFDPSVYFNGHLRMPPLQEIKEIEVTQSKVDGAALGLRGCEASACKAIVQQYTDLILDSNHVLYPFERKLTPEWQAQLADLLTAMAAWKSESAAVAAEHYREKSSLYSDLANIQPDIPSKVKVLRAELEYVTKDKASASNRAEWFLPVSALIGRVTLDPLGLGPMADDLRATGDAVITLFTELDSLAPRKPDQIMPLI
jgi:hypothetical protein